MPPPPKNCTGTCPCMQLKHGPTHLLQYAVARLGREDHLPVTTAVPATEWMSVAAGAPAKVIATSPTDRHHCLRRLADGSRTPTPEGSRPPCGGDQVATPSRPMTGRRALAPSSCTRSPIGSPCGSRSPRGGRRAYHVAPLKPAWVRSRLYAGGSTSASEEFGAPEPGHVPFGPSLSASLAWPM